MILTVYLTNEVLNMKNIAQVIIALLIALNSPSKSFAQIHEQADSLLWEVSGNGLKHNSYLTGTLHIMCEKDFGILPKVEKAIKSSGQLYLEINFNDPKEMQAMQSMVLTETLLTETLSAEQQDKLSHALKDTMGLSIQQVNQYSMTALLSMMMVKAVECPDMKFLDMELSTLAVNEGKTVKALETVEEQAQFFAKAYSNDLILEYFQHYDSYKEMFADMVEIFKAEDLNSLMEAMQDPRFSNDDVRHWLLKVRNENWIVKMPKIMREDSTVFAVGAAHLGGEFGVIKLLQDAGYSVKPVMN